MSARNIDVINYVLSETTVQADCREPITSMVRIYTYEKCDTCRKALKFLAARGIEA
jgi:hypothetical protein